MTVLQALQAPMHPCHAERSVNFAYAKVTRSRSISTSAGQSARCGAGAPARTSGLAEEPDSPPRRGDRREEISSKPRRTRRFCGRFAGLQPETRVWREEADI